MTPTVIGSQVSSPEDERNLRCLIRRYDKRSRNHVRCGVYVEIDVVGIKTEYQTSGDEVTIGDCLTFEGQGLKASVGC